LVNEKQDSPRLSFVDCENSDKNSRRLDNLLECQRLAEKAARKFASNAPKIHSQQDNDSGFETDRSKSSKKTKDFEPVFNSYIDSKAQMNENYVPMRWSGEKCFSKHRRKVKPKYFHNKRNIPILITVLKHYLQ